MWTPRKEKDAMPGNVGKKYKSKKVVSRTGVRRP
jgi:hypothetical protein